MQIISNRKKIGVEKKILLSLIIFIFLFFPASFPQEFGINKIEPPNWWAGMKLNKIQLMVYGKNLNDVSVTSVYPRIKVDAVHNAESRNYLFVDIEVPDDLPEGKYDLIFNKDDQTLHYNYPISERELLPEDHKGYSNADVIYLIFADRFCDGNPGNNTIGNSLDEFTSMDLDGRHGGDIEGIISKLDYLKDLGITALWITPMLENNMWMSYHGYAATNLYKIDPRFGSNELYKQLISKAHQKGLKIILDHVSNHIGINHPWMNDLPFSDWINGTVENHLPAHHDKMAFLDIHGDSIITEFTQEGWFENYMPDLNQRNPFLKKYLIQNTLWWIEFAGIDGIREDTYPYCDQKYLSDWAEAILNEYPNFNIVGEIWKGVPSVISGYQHNSPVRKVGFDSNLPTVTDFALLDALRDYLNGEKNIYSLYETLVQDIVYDNLNNTLVFFDNHDIERAMFVAKGNIQKFKIALNLVLFTRGIPTLFYGTEIGIKGGNKHGELRKPFPGGFSGDSRNAFTKSGRTEKENEIFDYLGELLKLRKEYPLLSKGSMRHIYLGGDLYIIIKTFEDELAMIMLNTGTKDVAIQPSRIKMFLTDVKKLTNIKSGNEIQLNDGETLTIKGLNTDIFLLEE